MLSKMSKQQEILVMKVWSKLLSCINPVIYQYLP
jgi:hypothetical protein